MKLNEIKKLLKIHTKEIIKSFKLLINFIDEHDYKYIPKIISNNDEISEINKKLISLILLYIKNLKQGEENRKIISYFLVTRAISGISQNASNVAKYISNVEGKGVKKKWIKDVSVRVLRRLESLNRLITYETVDSALALIDRDKSLGIMFVELISNYTRSSVSRSKLTTKEKKEVVEGFVIAIREMEQAGDSIKEAAEGILFISTGRF